MMEARILSESKGSSTKFPGFLDVSLILELGLALGEMGISKVEKEEEFH